MEAASRPPLEPLPDLPVEEPVDAARSAASSAKPSSAPPASAGSPTQSKDPEQTGLNFIDPDMFLSPGQAPATVPVLSPPPPVTADKAPETPELVLEDPVVDDLLTSPPPPPPKPAATAPAAAPPPKAAPPAEREAARVPIAKTASLKSAATKLAAASATRPGPKPTAAAAKAAPAAPSATSPSATPASAPPARAAAAKSEPAVTPSPQAPQPKLDAPSLASWQSARASVPAPSAPKPAPVSPPLPASAAPKSAAPSSASVAATPPPSPSAASALAAPSSPMDRDFIARNQVVERYLSGRLPLKGATEFERFCNAHPELLDDIGLPERVNAGLRLLEAAGKPEPWQEPTRAAWDRPQVTLSLAAAALVLAAALAVVAGGSASKSRHIAELTKQASERALDPATSTREIRLVPSRSGASNSPAIVIGGPNAQMADFKIDESRSPYHIFRVTIDRIDQGRVGVISNLNKDSNGHLRIALNSSALGPGNYQFTLEGLDWRGDPQPDSWITIGIVR
jgi:hypothetical protein